MFCSMMLTLSQRKLLKTGKLGYGRKKEFLVKIDCTEAGSWMFQLVEKYISRRNENIFVRANEYSVGDSLCA